MEDFDEMFKVSREITLEEWKKRPFIIKVIQNFLSLSSKR